MISSCVKGDMDAFAMEILKESHRIKQNQTESNRIS